MLNITQKEFDLLSNHIKENFGIHLKDEKKVLVIGRLRKLLEEMKFTNFSQYYDYILEDRTGDRARDLADRITTNHTYFMREPRHFDFFRDDVLPYLKASVKTRDLRIWSAACSTGEEAYTLAMLIDEFFGKEKNQWDTKILATDISDRVLKIAREGIYSMESLSPLPNYWKINYLKKLDSEKMIFNDKIKNEIIYRKFNLMEEIFPFKRKFHAIFLRNVMIYFDNETKDRLIEKMYHSLEYGGYLFIGHSESINREKSKFKYIRPAVYRK